MAPLRGSPGARPGSRRRAGAPAARAAGAAADGLAARGAARKARGTRPLVDTSFVAPDLQVSGMSSSSGMLHLTPRPSAVGVKVPRLAKQTTENRCFGNRIN